MQYTRLVPSSLADGGNPPSIVTIHTVGGLPHVDVVLDIGELHPSEASFPLHAAVHKHRNERDEGAGEDEHQQRHAIGGHHRLAFFRDARRRHARRGGHGGGRRGRSRIGSHHLSLGVVRARVRASVKLRAAPLLVTLLLASRVEHAVLQRRTLAGLAARAHAVVIRGEDEGVGRGAGGVGVVSTRIRAAVKVRRTRVRRALGLSPSLKGVLLETLPAGALLAARARAVVIARRHDATVMRAVVGAAVKVGSAQLIRALGFASNRNLISLHLRARVLLAFVGSRSVRFGFR